MFYFSYDSRVIKDWVRFKLQGPIIGLENFPNPLNQLNANKDQWQLEITGMLYC